jgi:rhomboid protease GluP
VGASGAVFGVVGALAAAVFTKHRHLPPAIGRAMRSSVSMFVGYSLLMGFLVPHIDNAAHLGGLATGFLMGTVMAEKFDREEFLRSGVVRACVAIAGAMVAGFAMWKLLPAPVA